MHHDFLGADRLAAALFIFPTPAPQSALSVHWLVYMWDTVVDSTAHENGWQQDPAETAA